MVEDRPHIGAMKGLITDRLRDDLMTFVSAGANVRLGRRKSVFAVG